MDSATLLQQLVNAVSLGSMYALIAIGYTMVYGILRLINFAHADIMMVGAFLCFLGCPFGLPVCLLLYSVHFLESQSIESPTAHCASRRESLC